MDDKAQLEDMLRYLNQEVPHYYKDKVKSVKPAGDFEFSSKKIRVYKVLLKSGRRVFAVESDHGGSVKNVYDQKLPNAETAGKLHIYTVAVSLGILRRKGLEELAEELELPERFRRTDYTPTSFN